MTEKEATNASIINATTKKQDEAGKEVLNSKTFMSFAFGDDLVRAAIFDDKEWFVANDVCKALGYERPRDAITAHCKGAVKRRALTRGGEQQMNFINEADLYRLIFSSKLPAAEQFADWVYEDVLPSIRKTGQYTTPRTQTKQLTIDEVNQLIYKNMEALKRDLVQTFNTAPKPPRLKILKQGEQKRGYKKVTLTELELQKYKMFIENGLVLVPTSVDIRISREDLKDQYLKWCDANGIPVVTKLVKDPKTGEVKRVINKFELTLLLKATMTFGFVELTNMVSKDGSQHRGIRMVNRK